MTGLEFHELLFEVRDRIALITINRPQVLNARNRLARAELMRTFRLVDASDDIVVGVLTGAGDRAFSVGMDLKEAGAATLDPLQARLQEVEVSDAMALAAVKKPMIAAINGYALGGGLELALCCDLRIASESAQLGMPEATRGIMPGSGGTQRLPRLIGAARAFELMLTGERISAAEALRIGLVSKVVPGTALIAEAEALARKLLSGAPLALRLIKEAVNSGLDMTLAQGLALEQSLSCLLTVSADAAEGVRAFNERRVPKWQGR